MAEQESPVQLGEIVGTGKIPNLYGAKNEEKEAAASIFQMEEIGAGREPPVPGVIREEESRGKYFGKTLARDLIGGGLSLATFLTVLYALYGRFIRDPAAARFRVDSQVLNTIYFFDQGDRFAAGGKSVLTLLQGSLSADINLNDPKTWKGKNFDEKANILWEFTETIRSDKGRGELIKYAVQQNVAIEEVSYFDQIMDDQEKALGRPLTWEETVPILREFGFKDPYLNILTELREVHSTGDGNLRKAIEDAKKVGKEGQVVKQTAAETQTGEEEAALRQQAIRAAAIEGKPATVARIGASEQPLVVQDEMVAQGLLEVAGLDGVVDGQTLREMAVQFPPDTTYLSASVGVDRWLPQLRLQAPLSGPLGDSPLAMLVILGLFTANNAIRFKRWAAGKFIEAAQRNPGLAQALGGIRERTRKPR